MKPLGAKRGTRRILRVERIGKLIVAHLSCGHQEARGRPLGVAQEWLLCKRCKATPKEPKSRRPKQSYEARLERMRERYRAKRTGNTKTCSRCGVPGHNVRSCATPTTSEEK